MGETINTYTLIESKIDIMKNTMAGSVVTLDPGQIRRINNRTVEKVVRLGDGFVAFIMSTVEDGETEINSAHFQATFTEICGFLHDHDFKTVPLESMDLIAEKLSVHRVKTVDMVIPFRKPPSRGFYLKYNPRINGYSKKELLIKNLQVEGDKFIVVAMHPMWERGS